MAHVSDFRAHGDRVCIRIENGRLLRVGTVDRDNAPPGALGGVLWDAQYDGQEWTWPDEWERLELYAAQVKRQVTEVEDNMPVPGVRIIIPELTS